MPFLCAVCLYLVFLVLLATNTKGTKNHTNIRQLSNGPDSYREKNYIWLTSNPNEIIFDHRAECDLRQQRLKIMNSYFVLCKSSFPHACFFSTRY